MLVCLCALCALCLHLLCPHALCLCVCVGAAACLAIVVLCTCTPGLANCVLTRYQCSFVSPCYVYVAWVCVCVCVRMFAVCYNAFDHGLWLFKLMHGSFTISITRLITLRILMPAGLITCLAWRPCLTTSHDSV
ncbi:hypothetical protein BC830DRAFT_1090911, partial [Chytriomyces sp. MP71]